VALDADTGKIKWHFQMTPHDLHDWDSISDPVLVDLTGFRNVAPSATRRNQDCLSAVNRQVQSANLVWGAKFFRYELSPPSG
jgi:alcohol dehydrogenase (cytochrome c)